MHFYPAIQHLTRPPRQPRSECHSTTTRFRVRLHRYLPILFLLCLYALLPAFSNAQEDAQEHLRKEYLNTTQVLRGFPDSSRLKYGSDGRPVHTYTMGPWTAYGRVHLTALKLKHKKLKITAQRQILLFDTDKRKLVADEWKKQQVLLEIATGAGPGQLQQLEQALHAIFIGSAETATAYPDYWVPYLSRTPTRARAAKQGFWPRG